MFSRGGRGSGQIDATGSPLLPSRSFSLTHAFAAPVLLSLFVRFFRSDRVPGTAYCKPESKIQNPTLQFDLD